MFPTINWWQWYCRNHDAGYLWAIHANILKKYTINSDGTLSTTGLTISSMTTPGGFGFFPNGNEVTVCDVYNQVVKSFSTSTGSLLWTLGTSGGYFTDATVTNSQFYFRDVNGDKHTFLAYLPDGSFYVGD